MSVVPAGDWLSGASALESYRELANRLDDALEQLGEGVLMKLHTEARELVEHALGRLVVGAEHGRMAMTRLREIGPPSELIEVAPAEAASAALLDRVLLSRLEQGYLWAESLYIADDPAGTANMLGRLKETPVKLDYPLVEWEVLRRRRPLLVRVEDQGDLQRYAYGQVMRWDSYVAAPLILEGRVVGFLHGDARVSGRCLAEVDRDALGIFAVAFPAVYELAVLRHRLRTQRQEMRQVAIWADTRTSELSDRAVTLNPDTDNGATRGNELAPPTADLLDRLTRREYDVLRLMADGESNGSIAQHLFVSVGTVKFHVKNIFRKMGVSSRSELVAQYLRTAVGDKGRLLSVRLHPTAARGRRSGAADGAARRSHGPFPITDFEFGLWLWSTIRTSWPKRWTGPAG